MKGEDPAESECHLYQHFESETLEEHCCQLFHLFVECLLLAELSTFHPGDVSYMQLMGQYIIKQYMSLMRGWNSSCPGIPF